MQDITGPLLIIKIRENFQDDELYLHPMSLCKTHPLNRSLVDTIRPQAQESTARNELDELMFKH